MSSRGCKGKRPFLDKNAALQVVEERVKWGTVRWRLNVYRCKNCGYWHVGHTPGRNNRQRR